MSGGHHRQGKWASVEIAFTEGELLTAGVKLHAMATQFAEERNVPYSQAFIEVQNQNRDLAEAYAEEVHGGSAQAAKPGQSSIGGTTMSYGIKTEFELHRLYQALVDRGGLARLCAIPHQPAMMAETEYRMPTIDESKYRGADRVREVFAYGLFDKYERFFRQRKITPQMIFDAMTIVEERKSLENFRPILEELGFDTSDLEGGDANGE